LHEALAARQRDAWVDWQGIAPIAEWMAEILRAIVAADAASKRKKLNPFIEPDFIAQHVEKMKASIRAKVEHPFRGLKRQFGFTKVRYRGLVKNTAQLTTLFALANPWMARRQLLEAQG
jgi:hypothetical protein